MWNSLKGKSVWVGLDEGYSGRGKKGCGEKIWTSMTEYGWSARIL